MNTKKITGKLARIFTAAFSVIFLFCSCTTVTLTDVNLSHHNPFKTASTAMDDTALSYHPDTDADKVLGMIPQIVSDEAYEWILNYESKYGANSASRLILDSNEIQKLNKQIISNSPTVVDISDIPETLTKKEITEKINHYSLPSADKFDQNGNYISWEARNTILSNRNIETISDNAMVYPGVVLTRCNLQSFPSELGFYNYGDTHYNAIQETELIAGSPIWILHESLDENYLFVQSYYYFGWVRKDDVAICTREEFDKWASPERYITMTTVKYLIDNTVLDMGVRLPYIREDTNYFWVILPGVDESKGLAEKIVQIPKTHAVYGSVEYTMENYFALAFSFLDVEYDWGGQRGGVDCSGYVCAVFRTFGIFLPRNTSDQAKYMGIEHTLPYGNSGHVLNSLSFPSTVHSQTHVMLYLGSVNNEHFVIHAPIAGQKVSVMKLNLSDSGSTMSKYTSAREIFPE